jgi:hypothetical protein
LAASKKATASDSIKERRQKKRTSIGNSSFSRYNGEHSVEKKYRGQGK